MTSPLFPDNIAEHIFAVRGGYTHHGVYIGYGEVIHFTGQPGHKSAAVIAKTTLYEFSQGDKMYRVVYDKRLSAQETIAKAHQHIGKGRYNLIFNNCEHFATWCTTGKARSKQVRSAASRIASILGPIAFGGVSVVALPVVAIGSLVALGGIRQFISSASIQDVEPFYP